jgi:hypothetical protein
MKQQFPFWSLPVAIGLAAMVAALPTECVYARGRPGGGGFGRGGFSRGGPAAAGSFASRPASMPGHAAGFRSSMPQGQANRMEYGQHAQASRQQEANTLQSNREQAARNLQSNAQQYRGAYPYRGLGYPAWDAGAGWAAAATGAAIGAAATSWAAPGYGSSAYPASQPCGNAESVLVGSTTFFRCGSSWYTQAYGPEGPTFVPASPPR